MAVGSYQSPSSATEEFIERWDGVTWTVSSGLVNANGNSLYSVSCPTPTFCVAAGQAYLDNPTPAASASALAEEWDGVTWTVMAQPPVLMQNNGEIDGVSCPSPTFCMAVGWYTNSPGGPALNLTETWDGFGWTIRSFSDPAFAFPGARLASLSCASPTLCFVSTAAVPNGSSAYLASWDGTVWTGLPAAGLLEVSCPTTSFCMALPGPSEVSGSGTPEEFNGITWTAVSAPTGPVDAVSCLSATFCMDAGYEEFSTVIASNLWTGNSWSAETPPVPTGQASTSLNAVSCPTTTECMAVGADTADPASLSNFTGIYSEVWVAPGSITPPPSPLTLTLTATPASLQVGATATLTATVTDPIGSPLPDVLITFGAASGPDSNRFRAILRTDIRGQAVTTIKGIAAGSDTLQAWIDSNSNGLVDEGEISATAPIRWLWTYVAFGDSVTTGYSNATCVSDRLASPWGCDPTALAAVPYPDRIAAALNLSYSDAPTNYASVAPNLPELGLDRVGIWGYTSQEASVALAFNADTVGPWMPQLAAVEQTGGLVTGALGIDDIGFSAPSHIRNWILEYERDKRTGRFVVADVKAKLAADKSALDAVFNAMSVAKNNGARVVLVLYYNPFDTNRAFCGDLKNLAGYVVNTVDNELLTRARQAGLLVADPRPTFAGHGSGSSDPFVFGTSCKVSTALADTIGGKRTGGNNLAVDFDPHPNNAGTLAISQSVLNVLAINSAS